ncbi:MAG: hypothetical protein L6V87_10130 [Ruminococcus sp.]|nr:MAG: hypothetical protein L6V87_10130 [Ruminococcus sp.]
MNGRAWETAESSRTGRFFSSRDGYLGEQIPVETMFDGLSEHSEYDICEPLFRVLPTCGGEQSLQ